MPLNDIFTFLTVYYKGGHWSQQEFTTLRDGLDDFLEDYFDSTPEQEREKLRKLPDDDLLQILLEIGAERLGQQVGHGLVAVVQGPDRYPKDRDPRVYLEVYYKHGEWSISQDWSAFVDEAMEQLEAEMGHKEWNAMTEEEQHDEAMERCEDDVKQQRGWGAVCAIAGKVVGEATRRR